MSFGNAFANALGNGIAQALTPLIAKEIGLTDSQQAAPNNHTFANAPSHMPRTKPAQHHTTYTSRPQKHHKPTMQIRTKNFFYKTST